MDPLKDVEIRPLDQESLLLFKLNTEIKPNKQIQHVYKKNMKNSYKCIYCHFVVRAKYINQSCLTNWKTSLRDI